MNQRKIVGNNGENNACEYLEKNNYTIIERNFLCRRGEIDIIAKDNNKEELVFIEVKTRKNYHYGNPIDSVTKTKQRHILLATKYYLYIHKLYNIPIRFDVIEILDFHKLKINHVINVNIFNN